MLYIISVERKSHCYHFLDILVQIISRFWIRFFIKEIGSETGSAHTLYILTRPKLLLYHFNRPYLDSLLTDADTPSNNEPADMGLGMFIPSTHIRGIYRILISSKQNFWDFNSPLPLRYVLTPTVSDGESPWGILPEKKHAPFLPYFDAQYSICEYYIVCMGVPKILQNLTRVV